MKKERNEEEKEEEVEEKANHEMGNLSNSCLPRPTISLQWKNTFPLAGQSTLAI